MELEKEIASIEVKCRELRNKKSDLQAETNRLFNDKIAIAKEIQLLMKEKDDLLVEISTCDQTLLEFRDKMKKESFEIAKRKSMLDQEDSKLKEMSQDINDRYKKLMDDDKHLDIERKNIKDAQNRFIGIETELNDRASIIKDREEELSKMIRDIEKDKFDLRANINKLKVDATRADESMKQSQETYSQLQRKTLELEGDKLTIQSRWQELEKAEESINRKKAELVIESNRLRDEWGKIDNIKRQLDAGFDDLKGKEDTFEIKRLRLDKSIRDGDVRDELARLRKDIEK